MESFFSTVKIELADRFASLSEAKMELFDSIEVLDNQRRRHSTLGQISPAAFERRAAAAYVHRGALGGQLLPATDNDGHATKRPSTFFGHRRRLIQPTRKPSDLTNPSTESDQAQ